MTDLSDRALAAIAAHFGAEQTRQWRLIVHALESVPGMSSTLKALARAPDEEAAADYLCELQCFALCLHLGFTVQVEPLGSGPDAEITRDGESAYLEITRFRKVHDGPPDLNAAIMNPRLIGYGDISRDSKKAYDKILGKFKQADRGRSIVWLWSDDGDLEDVEFEIAVNDIIDDAAHGRLNLPSELLFVVFGSRWFGGAKGTQFHVRALQSADHRWMPLFAHARLSQALASVRLSGREEGE